MKKADEPMVRISRKCMACESIFILTHSADPHLLCERCRKKLVKIINEVQDVD